MQSSIIELVRAHKQRQKALQAKIVEEESLALRTAEAFFRTSLDIIDSKVSRAYVKQQGTNTILRSIDARCKELESQIIKWNYLSEQINLALKELGDTSNFLNCIQSDVEKTFDISHSDNKTQCGVDIDE
ncbi:hypothetical protein GJ496_004096 [Pomphorhynchus laevis]|nr:hypothetical protein GJ496_004096 [Pomphorhynchus laevis]